MRKTLIDRKRRPFVVLIALVLLTAACGSDDDDSAATTETSSDPVAAAEAQVAAAESAVTDAQDGVTAAGEQLCSEASRYVDALDRYGKLFTDDAATVGDVQTAGADLVEPRETVSAAIDSFEQARAALGDAELALVEAQAELADAISTASSLPTSSTEPAATTTSTIVPSATIERVQEAEDDLAKTAAGITAATPLSEATAEYNSAAFALQIAWMQLLAAGGCLSDEELADAVDQVTTYTLNLQTQLQLAGLYDGAIDGIYGPKTVDAVKQLQADSGLRETGYVDRATAEALDAKLAALGLQQANAELTSTAAVQTVLTLTGFWTGPIDGLWSDELTAALQAFQTALGVEPTGEVDTATLAAFEQALATLESIVTTPTTVRGSEPPPVVTQSPETAPPAATSTDPSAGSSP